MASKSEFKRVGVQRGVPLDVLADLLRLYTYEREMGQCERMCKCDRCKILRRLNKAMPPSREEGRS